MCEEEATFTQGTDIRVETREVYRQSCLSRCDFRVEPGVPFTAVCGIRGAAGRDALVSIAAQCGPLEA